MDGAYLEGLPGLFNVASGSAKTKMPAYNVTHRLWRHFSQLMVFAVKDATGFYINAETCKEQCIGPA